MKDNIILIGYMGSGKSLTGEYLAKSLGYSFMDVDDAIESLGTQIPELFKKFGESGFRRLESTVIEEISSLKHYVIATGSGVIECSENIERLKNLGYVVYLEAPVTTLWWRVKRSGKERPLAVDFFSFNQRLQKRKPQYVAMADLTVNVDRKGTEMLVNIIKEHYEKFFEM